MLYDEIARNKRNSFLIILFFLGFIVLAAWIYTVAFEYSQGEQIGLLGMVGVISCISAFIGYYSSARIALVATGAVEAPKEGPFRELHRLVENLCITAGLPKPKVCVIDDPSPNAFATGRNPENAAIAVTTGLLNLLEKKELEGVLAHEISHIQNYDIRLGTIVVVFVGIIAMLSDIMQRVLWYGGGRRKESRGGKGGGIFVLIAVIFMILSPLIAKLIQFAMSRQREFLADASAVELTRYPEGLASALEKITRDDTRMKRAGTATAHLFIASPFSKEKESGFFKDWFSTHPDPTERIKKLRAMFNIQ